MPLYSKLGAWGGCGIWVMKSGQTDTLCCFVHYIVTRKKMFQSSIKSDTKLSTISESIWK